MQNSKLQLKIQNFIQDKIQYLLYLFVFLLPWQTRWIFKDAMINGEVWEYGRMSLYALDVVFLLLLSCYLAILLKRKFLKEKFSQIFIPYSLFLIPVIVNILIAGDKSLAIYWWLRIFQGIVLIWLIKKIDFSKYKLVLSFVISVAISAGLGIYQFFTQNVFASKWLGMASQLPEKLGTSVIEINGERWLRAYGSFSHPNILGAMCLLSLVLLFWIFIKNKSVSVFECLSALVLTSGLFFSFSRASWIGAIALCIMYFVLCIFKKVPIKNIVFLCLSVFVFLCLLFLPLVKTRILGSERLEVKSNTERVENNLQSIDVIKNNLWLGVGVGNYTVELQKINSSLEAWNYQPVHNVYLLILSEIGVVGVLLICYLVILLMKNEKLKKKKWLLVVVCWLLVAFLFDHFWWTQASGMLSVFLMIGLLSRYKFNIES